MRSSKRKLEIKTKGSEMTKLLGTAVLAAVLGATSLQAITSKEALNIAEKNFPGSSVKDIEIDVKNGATFYKVESFKDGGGTRDQNRRRKRPDRKTRD